jgi:hypothetical protein
MGLPDLSAGVARTGSWTALLVSAGALYLTAFVLSPANSYLLNADEVAVSLARVMTVTWRIQLAFVVAIVVIGRWGRPTGRLVAAGLMLALSCLLYVQGHVIIQNYGPMNGSDIDWASHRLGGVFELVLWCFCLVLGPLLTRRFPAAVARVAMAVVVLQAVTIGAQLLQGRSFRPAQPPDLDHELLKLSPDKNVLVFVFDAFQSTILERLLVRDPSVAEKLEGFTYFDDTLGLYPTTIMSIPAILTGQIYDNTVPVDDFLSSILPAKSLPGRFAEQGFRASTVTNLTYCKYFEGEPCVRADAFLDWNNARVLYRDCLQIWDVTLFRHAPHFLKMKVYEDQSWLLQSTLMADHMAGSQKNHLLDFRRDLKSPSRQQEGSRVLLDHYVNNVEDTSDRPVFEFIHVYTTHAPFVVGSDCERIDKQTFRARDDLDRMVDQGACAVLRLAELIERLQELGIFDNTLIVATADHGSMERLLDVGGPSDARPDLNRALPLLLVKPFGASGPMRRSTAPASLSDVARTVAQLAGLDADFPGVALFGEEVPRDRRRVFFDYEWEDRFWRTTHLPSLKEYVVLGRATDPDSWSAGRVISAPE